MGLKLWIGPSALHVLAVGRPTAKQLPKTTAFGVGVGIGIGVGFLVKLKVQMQLKADTDPDTDPGPERLDNVWWYDLLCWQ